MLSPELDCKFNSEASSGQTQEKYGSVVLLGFDVKTINATDSASFIILVVESLHCIMGSTFHHRLRRQKLRAHRVLFREAQSNGGVIGKHQIFLFNSESKTKWYKTVTHPSVL